MKNFFKQIGFLYSLPVLFVLFATFAAPLLVVIAYSFMPPKTIDFHHLPTLENFKYMFEEQQSAIYQQQMEDMRRIFEDDPNNRFPN